MRHTQDSRTVTRRAFLAAASVVPFATSSGFGWLDAAATTQTTPMQTRVVPKSKVSIPVIGMGTWQTFDPPALDDGHLAPLREVLKAFFDAGGRVVDSSPMYGKSEEVAGRLAAELGINDQLFVATKVWTRGKAEGERQMRESLRLLQREKIELMQIHNLLDWQTHLDTIRAWKAEGTFRHIGITHYQPGAFDELERLMRTEALDFVQLPYSVGMREAEARLLPAAKDSGTAVLVMRPFEGGTLFRNVRDKPLPDWITPWAGSWAQAFLKWILGNEAVTCAIPATSKPAHMRDNVLAGTGRLPDEAERKRFVEAVGA